MDTILRYRDFLKTYKTRGYRINHLQNYKYLFPIKTNQILAGIIADLIGDGHLQEDPKWRIDFTSKSIKELKRFEKEIKLLFNVNCAVRKCQTNKFGSTYNISMNCSPITRILFLCGVPSGQKVLKQFRIPEWIKKDKKCFKRFVQRLFTCEGSVISELNRKPRIRLEMWNVKKDSHFLEDLSKYLKEHFKIKSKIYESKRFNKRKDNIITIPRIIYIVGESVGLFYNEIGFEGEKQDKLKRLINTTK